MIVSICAIPDAFIILKFISMASLWELDATSLTYSSFLIIHFGCYNTVFVLCANFLLNKLLIG